MTSKVPTFGSEPDWRCPRYDKQLMVLFSDCFVGTVSSILYPQRFYIVDYPMQGTLANNSFGFMPGCTPVCDGGINHLLSKRSERPESNFTFDTTAYKLLNTSVVPKAYNSGKLLMRSRIGNLHSVAMYNWQKARFTLLRCRLFELLVLYCIENKLETTLGQGTRLKKFDARDWMKDWITGRLVRDTISFPISESSFRGQLLVPVMAMFGVKSQGARNIQQGDLFQNFNSSLVLASHKLHFLDHSGGKTNVVFGCRGYPAIRATKGANVLSGKEFNDTIHFDKDSAGLSWVTHCIDLSVVKVPDEGIDHLEILAKKQIKSVPYDHGDPSKFFDTIMVRYSPACPTLWMARCHQIGNDESQFGLCRLFGYDQASDPTKEQLTKIRNWSAMEVLKSAFGDKVDANDYHVLDTADYLQSTFDTDMKFVNGSHISVRPSFLRQVQEEMGGVVGSVLFPLCRFGMFTKHHAHPTDRQGQMVYIDRGSALVGPASLSRETGYLTHPGGNRHVHLTIVAIPKKGKDGADQTTNDKFYKNLLPEQPLPSGTADNAGDAGSSQSQSESPNLLPKAYMRSYPHIHGSLWKEKGSTCHDQSGVLDSAVESQFNMVYVHKYDHYLKEDRTPQGMSPKKKKKKKAGLKTTGLEKSPATELTSLEANGGVESGKSSGGEEENESGDPKDPTNKEADDEGNNKRKGSGGKDKDESDDVQDNGDPNMEEAKEPEKDEEQKHDNMDDDDESKSKSTVLGKRTHEEATGNGKGENSSGSGENENSDNLSSSDSNAVEEDLSSDDDVVKTKHDEKLDTTWDAVFESVKAPKIGNTNIPHPFYFIKHQDFANVSFCFP